MAINPKCDKCKEEMKNFGAIVISPPSHSPTEGTIWRKYHLCLSCWSLFKEWMFTPPVHHSLKKDRKKNATKQSSEPSWPTSNDCRTCQSFTPHIGSQKDLMNCIHWRANNGSCPFDKKRRQTRLTNQSYKTALQNKPVHHTHISGSSISCSCGWTMFRDSFGRHKSILAIELKELADNHLFTAHGQPSPSQPICSCELLPSGGVNPNDKCPLHGDITKKTKTTRKS